jgi:putative oxidoreductase
VSFAERYHPVARPITSTMSGDEVILAARIMLVALFVVFGWDKLIHFGTTVDAMAHRALPLPTAAAAIAVAAELPLCVLILLGAWTRPLALLLAVYTVATAFIGHSFWELEGPARYANTINFYKNWSIVGGFLLLYVTGPGRYSVDAKLLALGAPKANPDLG